ncbi:MAG: thioredoxin family protein [SAR92 clade bacterium]|nr:thioredoxin family protein [SAR92 clade bacterium]|tara:strand:- start:76 stop:474 length:399 start_codon:yes stop_codon:yes gene_type:complete
MNRRTFISVLTGLVLMSGMSFANESIVYTPGLIKERLSAGETLFVDYSATWCSTCNRQEKILTKIRENNSAYDEKMTFVKIDWDTYKGHEVTSSRNIPRRSTLLVLRGNEEIGRIIAGTDPKEIEALMDKGL